MGALSTSQLLELEDRAEALVRAPHCIAQDLLALQHQFVSEPVGVGGKVPRTFVSKASELFQATFDLYAEGLEQDAAQFEVWSGWSEPVALAVAGIAPLRICRSLRPLSARWSPVIEREQVFEITTGKLFDVPATTLRSLLGHALAEALETCCEVFPDALAQARAEPEKAAAPEPKRAVSPFRERQRQLSLGDDFDLEAAELMNRSGAASAFRQALAELGQLSGLQLAEARAKKKVKLLDRLNVFSDSAEEQVVAGLETAIQRQVSRLNASLTSWLKGAEQGFSNVLTYRRLKAVYDATLQLRAQLTILPNAFSRSSAMAELVGDNELRRQLGALEPLVSRATGIEGGWPALIASLAEPDEPSEDEVVSALRAALQATSSGRELLARLSRDPDQASEQDLAELGPFAAAHPAAALYFAVPQFLTWTEQFVARAEFDKARDRYRGVVDGQQPFLDAFAIWARDLMARLGPAVSSSQFVELAMLKKLEAVEARAFGEGA